MQYLIEMDLADSGRPVGERDAAVFIEELVLPTLERCLTLGEEKRILAGGPMCGRIGIAMIVEAGSAREIDELVAGLPLWSRMDTTVVPLSSFSDRRAALLPRLDELRHTRQQATS